MDIGGCRKYMFSFPVVLHRSIDAFTQLTSQRALPAEVVSYLITTWISSKLTREDRCDLQQESYPFEEPEKEN